MCIDCVNYDVAIALSDMRGVIDSASVLGMVPKPSTSPLLVRTAILPCLQLRSARVALIQPSLAVHDEVVADVVEFWVIVFLRSEFDVLEREAMARFQRRAVSPDKSVVFARGGDVLKVKVVPPRQPVKNEIIYRA